MENFNHIPVLLDECIEGLNINPEGIYVDGTLGGGGHSGKIAERLTTGRLIAIDKDEEAIMFAAERLSRYHDRITYVHDDFKNYKSILEGLNIRTVDGILLDLGVSSYQIDTPERGFSYMQDAPLDMRMDRSQYLSAFNVVNEYGINELTRVLQVYGEERYARRIAENIVKARETVSIRTTKQLAEIVEASIPAAVRWKGGNPNKRTFQAIRIEVNGELDRLGEAVKDMVNSLNPNGRICVISFHSLEDRVVKQVFKDFETDCICDKSLPVCVCGHKREVNGITRKPTTAFEEELKLNPRAESAKLRIVEKI